jgi:hypothetical protein
MLESEYDFESMYSENDKVLINMFNNFLKLGEFSVD